MRHVTPGPRRQPARVAANKVIGEVARNWAGSFPELGSRALLLLRHRRWERRTHPCPSTPSAFFQQSALFCAQQSIDLGSREETLLPKHPHFGPNISFMSWHPGATHTIPGTPDSPGSSRWKDEGSKSQGCSEFMV